MATVARSDAVNQQRTTRDVLVTYGASVPVGVTCDCGVKLRRLRRWIGRSSRILAAICILATADATDLLAQDRSGDAIVRRLDALDTLLRIIQQEMSEIKNRLPIGPPPKPVVTAEELTGIETTITDAPVLGNSSARLVIIEFSDFQCPFCGRHDRETFPNILRELVDVGEVQYSFRHLPLGNIHPQAFGAAEAAECAGMEGKFWEMRKMLFSDQNRLSEADIIDRAGLLGVDVQAFSTCLRKGTKARIDADVKEADRLNISATPTFLIGEVDVVGSVRVRRGIAGAQPFSAFKAVLDGLIVHGSAAVDR